MSSRINVLMTAYETAEFVEASLASIYDFADEIVIMEGAWAKEMPPRSTDETIEIIENFPDPEKKIIIGKYSRRQDPSAYPFVSSLHRNAIMENPFKNPYYNGDVLQQQLMARDMAFRLLTNPAGWLFFVDSDEVHNKNSLEMVSAILETCGNSYNSFSLLGKNFYFGYKYYAKEYYQRIIKIPESAKNIYMDRSCCLSWDPPNDIVIMEIPENLASFLHYGYVGYERVKRKLSMWDKQTVDKWFERHADLWEGAEYDGRGVHLFEGINPIYLYYPLNEYFGNRGDLIVGEFNA